MHWLGEPICAAQVVPRYSESGEQRARTYEVVAREAQSPAYYAQAEKSPISNSPAVVASAHLRGLRGLDHSSAATAGPWKSGG